MKTIKLTLLLISITLSSCSEFSPSDGRFYVKDITIRSRYKATYQFIPVKGWGQLFVNNLPNKYMLGDTVSINKIH